MKNIVFCDDARPESVVPLCKKYGAGIEIQGFYDSNVTDKKAEMIARYRQLLPDVTEKHLHAPFWDLNMGSNNKSIARITRFYFDYAYEIAETLGCRSITVHNGFVPGTSNPANWVKRAVAFLSDFLADHPGSICLNIENLIERDPEIMIDVIDSVGSDRLGANLDIGHAHALSRIPVTAWVEALGSRIKYVHIHQNSGDRDSHLGLTQGNIPLQDVFNALEKHSSGAIWALECSVDHMTESAEYMANNGYIKLTSE